MIEYVGLQADGGLCAKYSIRSILKYSGKNVVFIRMIPKVSKIYLSLKAAGTFLIVSIDYSNSFDTIL
jgi:hypothetical protein